MSLAIAASVVSSNLPVMGHKDIKAALNRGTKAEAGGAGGEGKSGRQAARLESSQHCQLRFGLAECLWAGAGSRASNGCASNRGPGPKKTHF